MVSPQCGRVDGSSDYLYERSPHRSGSDALYEPFSLGVHHPRIEFPIISKYDLV